MVQTVIHVRGFALIEALIAIALLGLTIVSLVRHQAILFTDFVYVHSRYEAIQHSISILNALEASQSCKARPSASIASSTSGTYQVNLSFKSSYAQVVYDDVAPVWSSDLTQLPKGAAIISQCEAQVTLSWHLANTPHTISLNRTYLID